MHEVVLDSIPKNVEEGTIQTWFVEEGDPVNEGDDLVEISTEDGSFRITAATSGVLAEVYFDEGESVSRGEILCTIEEEGDEEDDDEDEDSDDDDDDSGRDDEDEDEDEDED